MSTTWTQPAQALISEATAGWEGIWSLTYAAGFGALNLAMSVPLGVAEVHRRVGDRHPDAQDELEWARPNLRATAASWSRIARASTASSTSRTCPSRTAAAAALD